MADVFSSIFKPKAFTALNRETGEIVLSRISVLGVNIKYSSQTLDHRMESGKTVIDARIVKPTRISVDIIAANPDQLEEVNSVILDRTGLYLITTKGLQFDNMKVSPSYISQSSKNISSTPIRLEFVQTLLENRDPIIFEFAADSSLMERGVAVINQATSNVQEVFTKVTSPGSRGYDVASDLFQRTFNR